MRDFRDAKAMAHTLREALKEKSVSLTHGESLELVAKTLGFRDWNELAGKIRAGKPTIGSSGSVTITPRTSSAGVVHPIIPLRDMVLFPQMVRPIFVGRAKTARAIGSALATKSSVLVVTQRRAAEDAPGRDDLFSVGVTANVVNCQKLPDDTLKLFVAGLQRGAIVRMVDEEYAAAEVAPIEERRGLSAEAATLSRAVIDAWPTLFRQPPTEDPGALADSVGSLLAIEIEKKQQILEAADVVARLEMVLDLMKAGRARPEPPSIG